GSIMKNLLRRIRNDEEGASMIEYVVLLGLITAAAIAILTTLGGQVVTIFTNISTALTGVIGA
ncbi:MAG: Flp family type IVb pilin, partial [Methylocella sp.]